MSEKPKGYVRLLFQSNAPKETEMVSNGKAFLVLEATPKPDGEHRYFGAIMTSDNHDWVTPLHADLKWPGEGDVPPGEVRLMQLHFRACPKAAAVLASGAAQLQGKVGIFDGTVEEWAESIGYEILEVPDDPNLEGDGVEWDDFTEAAGAA